jgi:7-cyano-7-deazaguanine synthase
MTGTVRRAVVLLSGGLDSATTLAIARTEGFEAHALTFRYGQRHEAELRAAAEVAAALGAASQREVVVDLGQVGGSALTADIPVPKHRSAADIGEGIPVTYVPARNTIFLAFALAWCEVLDARDIFIGVNALDYSGYPDCRPEFIAAFERMASLATRAGLEGNGIVIHAPLIHLSKADIIRRGQSLGVDFGLTHSCYDPGPGGLACGACDACLLRARGFREAGVPDPTRYVEGLPR